MSHSTFFTPNRTERKFIFGLIVLMVQATFAYAQTTAFTYQGRLTDAGIAADGAYDMQFKLTDANGTQVGSTISLNGVTINNGVFTVLLNFGNQFPGEDRRLEIGIKPAGSADPFTILLPRQPITSTPYAIRAANATQLGGVAADQYVTTNDPRLTPGFFIQNSTSPQVGQFNITGKGSALIFSAAEYDLDSHRILGSSGNRTFVGLGAGELDTQGVLNTYVGRFAGNKNVGGSANTYVGTFAASIAIGDNNAAFGANAGDHLIAGDNNTFLGAAAGTLVQGGSDNTSVGYHAGGSGTSQSNSFFGSQSGGMTTGARNSFFGASSGFKNFSGHNNAFFGYLSGSENTSASNNAFFGSHSGSKNTTGQSNSFFGNAAGAANQTASDNAYFGTNAGTKSTGATNAFFGSAAGNENLGGFANSFFGMASGLMNQQGFHNSFFGRSAGSSNGGGSNNTILGAFADVGAPSLTFATAIGAQAQVNTSNTIVLGRSNGSDTVQIPGILTVSSLSLAGLTSVCRNPLNQLSTCSSSLRYKTNIAPFTRGLALLNKLKPISFNWRMDQSADLGFGAEDVAAVEPLLVTHNEQGEVEGVKYDRITAVLVNAVKEQQEQIKLQQQQIRALKRLVCAHRRNVGVCR